MINCTVVRRVGQISLYRQTSSLVTRHVGNRSGYTLLEMALIVGLTGWLLSLAAVTLHRAFRNHQNAVDAVLHQNQLNSLRTMLGRDLALASSLELEPSLLIHSNNERSIQYEWTPTEVTRSVTTPERTSLNSWSFRILSWETQIDRQGALPLVRMDISVARDNESPHAEPPAESFSWLFRLGAEVNP